MTFGDAFYASSGTTVQNSDCSGEWTLGKSYPLTQRKNLFQFSGKKRPDESLGFLFPQRVFIFSDFFLRGVANVETTC
jgi:hypothetical protein